MSIAALAAIFGTAFVVSLSGALSPGPLTTLAVREGARTGFWAGPALAFGHGVVELLLVIGLALGLNQVLDRDAVTAAIALLGGSFLLWLGVRTLITAPRQELQIQRETQEAGAAAGPLGRRLSGALGPVQTRALAPLMLAGVVASVTNPYWVAWWATIGTAYIVESLEYGVAGVATFYTAHILTDIGWLSLIAFVLAGGRRLMSRTVYRGILGACGLFLLALGVWFLSSGLGYVL
jgi:threonine/homoserine/homoserine lactone efflux protein